MKYLSLLFCLIFSCISAQDCTLTVTGTVKDFHDGTNIQDATIYIEQINKHTTSNSNGVFTFTDLCKGEYTITVSHLNCETKTFTSSVNDDTVIEVLMEHHIEELNEVTVKGETVKNTLTSQETLITTNKIEQYSSGNIGDALKEVSGVSSINTGNAIVKPVINGLHSSRIIIMNNGVRLQDQEWGIEHAPNIDINSAGSISVIKGADALEFGGDAIGGTVIINPTKVVLKDSIYGKVLLNGQTNGRGYSTSSSVTKTYEKGWYASAQASIKRFGDFEAPDYNLTNTGLNSKSFSINSGYKTFEKGFNIFYSYIDNEIGILRASHLGNVEDFERAISSDIPLTIDDFSYDINNPKQEIKHHLAKVTFYKRLQSLGKLNVQYDFQNNRRFEFDLRRGNRDEIPAVDLKLTTHSLKANIKIDNNIKRVFNIGLVGSYQNNFASPETGVRRLIPDYDRYDFGTFIISTLRLTNKTLLNAGLRYDFNRYDAKKFYESNRWNELGYNQDFSNIILEDFGTELLTNPKFDYHNLSGSLGLFVNINENNTINVNYSLSNRAPNPAELFSDGLHHSAARIELGDLRIDQETSNRFSTTYNYKNKQFSLLLESYLNLINDFIYIEPTGSEQTIRGYFPIWGYKQTNATLFGIDFTGEYKISSNWVLSNKSSFIKGNDVSNSRALIDMPPFETETKLSFNKPEWNNLNLNLISQAVFRQNEFPDNNFEVFIPSRNEFVLVDVSTPPPGYHLMHFRSSLDFDFKNQNVFTIGLQIENIFNTSYRNYLNRLRYFADDLGRNIQLQLKLNF